MEIEFLEGIHLYLVDGVITPSVSNILKFIIPNKYANVPITILRNKAEFGTHVHNAIELYEKELDFELTETEQQVFEQYLKLKDEYDIQPIEQEKIVAYKQHFCGRLDMIATINGIKSLIDIKTTAKLDKESLGWQLGMYKLGHEFLYKESFEKCYCLWLPKNALGKLVEIEPKTKEEIETMLKEFEKQKGA